MYSKQICNEISTEHKQSCWNDTAGYSFSAEKKEEVYNGPSWH